MLYMIKVCDKCRHISTCIFGCDEMREELRKHREEVAKRRGVD